MGETDILGSLGTQGYLLLNMELGVALDRNVFFLMSYIFLVLQRAQYFLYLPNLSKWRVIRVEKKIKIYNKMVKTDTLGSLGILSCLWCTLAQLLIISFFQEIKVQ